MSASAKAADDSTELKLMSPLVADKLRDASPGDEVWMKGRKTPLKIQQINHNDGMTVFNAQGNGYDYIIRLHEFDARGDCVRFASRGSGEDLTDDLQGVRHVDD